MNAEIDTALRLYGEASDLALDWLIASWEQEGLDREIAFLYYQKATTERQKLAKRLEGICQA